MRFSLLGPLKVTGSSGGQAEVGGPRLRVLLAALLLHANVPVPADELAEVVWDGAPPPGAVPTLRSYVRRLRSALGDDATRIVARGPGYLIQLDRAELDVLEFEALCQDARAALGAEKLVHASATAMRALRLWQAPPLLDVPADALRGEFVPRLDQLRLQVLEDRFDAGLRLGQHQELVSLLLAATAEYPLQERFRGQLMHALAGSGRRAEALRVYREARRVLVDELGIEPGPELRDIHRQVLADDPAQPGKPAEAATLGEIAGTTAAGALAPRAASSPPPAPAGPAPAQLPADIADFTGREAQTAYLYRELAGHEAARGPGMARVAVVAGTAGLGKTTLAVHAAHQARELFPDGQLYAHLSGASGRPAVPGEVLGRFLRDLGVDGDKIPAGQEEREALYRTRLADRSVLILLDDARDASQVRPLLPGSASCAVVVTTRNKTPYLLSGTLVDLGTLPEPEALELFSRIVGDARPAAEPEATTEILTACAGLPLAVRICAARLASRRQWRIATMAARLRDERRRLDELQVGDLEIRASFQVSYDSLSGARQRVHPARAFRLLGLWHGHQISLPAAAALIGEQEEDVAAALEALVDANLLESPEPDRYQLHDLLRLFAVERVRAEETPESQLEAVTRLLECYLRTATAAAEVLSPHRYRIPDQQPAPGPSAYLPQDALDWYDGEQANVIAVIRQAAAAGLHDAAWRLSTALFPLFSRRHNWADCVTAHRMAVSSARASQSCLGEAWALQNLGQGLVWLREMEASACLEQAMAIRRSMGDLVGQAQTAVSIGHTYYTFLGPQAAYDHSLPLLEIVRQAGNPALLGVGLNDHAEFCRLLGKADEAIECLQEALGIWTSMEGGYGHGHVLDNLGRIHLESGRLDEAIANLSEAHRVHLASGDLMGQAQALWYLGKAQHSAHRADQARESLEAALALFSSLKAVAEADDVHAALTALGPAGQTNDHFSKSMLDSGWPAAEAE